MFWAKASSAFRRIRTASGIGALSWRAFSTDSRASSSISPADVFRDSCRPPTMPLTSTRSLCTWSYCPASVAFPAAAIFASAAETSMSALLRSRSFSLICAASSVRPLIRSRSFGSSRSATSRWTSRGCPTAIASSTSLISSRALIASTRLAPMWATIVSIVVRTTARYRASLAPSAACRAFWTDRFAAATSPAAIASFASLTWRSNSLASAPIFKRSSESSEREARPSWSRRRTAASLTSSTASFARLRDFAKSRSWRAAVEAVIASRDRETSPPRRSSFRSSRSANRIGTSAAAKRRASRIATPARLANFWTSA